MTSPIPAERELPKLPTPMFRLRFDYKSKSYYICDVDHVDAEIDVFTSGQMTAYASAALAERPPLFEKTYCSQCGGEFGPGNEGFSHCDQHTSPPPTERWTASLDEDEAASLSELIRGEGEASAITLHAGDGHSGKGLYASLTEYPDEGSVLLTSTVQAAATPSRSPEATYETPGYALAMRVLQSDLYRKLDERETAECNALIAAGQAPADGARESTGFRSDVEHDAECYREDCDGWCARINKGARETDAQVSDEQIMELVAAHSDVTTDWRGRVNYDFDMRCAIDFARAVLALRAAPVADQEAFCYCDDEISLQSVSGGASPEGLYGRLRVKVNGEYVDYVRAASAPQQPAPQEPTRSQKLAAAGYTRRPSWRALPPDDDERSYNAQGALLRPSELDDAIYELLGTLAGIDTHDTDLRDHDQAWKVVEAYERKIRGHERAAGKDAALLADGGEG